MEVKGAARRKFYCEILFQVYVEILILMKYLVASIFHF